MSRFNVSERMYNEFLRPTLLVGLFATPESLSAAAVINTLYYYALAHQSDFDVCWCKVGHLQGMNMYGTC